MEVLRNLLIRFRHSGVLLFIGFILIIYVAFGLVYWQQYSKQKDLDEQVARISRIVDKPLASKEKLQADYDKVNSTLTMKDVEISIDEDITTNAKAIAIIVGIAEKSGINVTPDSGKLIVPSASPPQGKEEQVGGGTYQVFSFKNVSAQGNYNNVMAFISDLDSGTTQATMVLKRVDIGQIEVRGEGGEIIRTETKASLDVDLYTKL